MADDSSRQVRWQRAAMDQLGYTLNLTFGLTIAALGYWFFLLTDDDFQPGGSAKCLMILSLSALGFSAICGLFCVVNRLWDVHGTARLVKSHHAAPDRDHLHFLGNITWVLFYTHLGTFALGVILLAIALLLTYGCKLA